MMSGSNIKSSLLPKFDQNRKTALLYAMKSSVI